MSKVLGFVLGLILAATAAAGMKVSSTSPTSSSWTEEWKFVCGVRQVDCSEITPPVVVTLPLQQMGIWGIFEPGWDSDVVFIDNALPETWQNVVGVHELSHYLDYQLGGLRRNEAGEYDLPELCKSEDDGFRVANAWVWYMGYNQDFARYDWRADYIHCQERTNVGLD